MVQTHQKAMARRFDDDISAVHHAHTASGHGHHAHYHAAEASKAHAERRLVLS